MHHQDFSADPPGTGSRKTAFHYRRGSSGASSGANAVEDNPTQAGSSSPGPHHQPQSQVAGAQVKKKSGFQITSVTSAQVNVSGNNSLADDTESYDDMDESHTEDLSSSDMLDVSVSRATDTGGVPERSSSDETLNSLHGVDTPGIASPNEPLHPHSIPQGSQQHTSMVNGTMHHHYYPQQHSQPHHHHSDSLGGSEPSVPALPIAPVGSSSPSMSQRPSMLDNSTPAGGTTQPPASVVDGTPNDQQLQGNVNVSNATAAAVPPSGPAGLDNTGVSGHSASVGGTGPPAAAAALHTQTQHLQTHTATGSRFRVVKLDTNSEPFRKGRWTCTDYYEKEVPHQTTSEAPKGVEVAVETDSANSLIGQGIPAVHPPHTLQPYQQPSQDFTSPQAMQSPPQGLAQTTPLTYISPQEVVGGAHMQQTVASVTAPAQAGVNQPHPVKPQQFPYSVDPQGGYSASQFHAGVTAPGGVRQPDFIQPTAPFQTQVQPPLPHVTPGISVSPLPGSAPQPPISFTQQLTHQGLVAPTAQASFVGQLQNLPNHPQVQPHSTARLPGALTHPTHYMPLTALQADLQPLLTLGGGSSIRTSQLEDAQKLLLQHQGLLSFPRLGMTTGGEGGAEAGMAHMGMSAEASAFMVAAAAAAGLRSQHAEGEEDSSSGASVVAIDNKIEQAMDLVKSHLMYAVREEVEVLKEQIKELIERNTQLEQENNLLKNLASPEQMAQFQAQVQTGGSPTGAAQPPVAAGPAQALPSAQSSGTSA